jgi:hypothetical protein
MKKQIIYSLCLLLMFLTALPVSAQQAQKTTRTVTGSVVDENGEPIMGATVMVQGSSVGTSTDIDGKFSIQVPEKEIISLFYRICQANRIEPE